MIGANTVVTRDVPDDSVLVGIGGTVVEKDGKKNTYSKT
jgi:serine acetyltransferase